jgi:hypothetical protein
VFLGNNVPPFLLLVLVLVLVLLQVKDKFNEGYNEARGTDSGSAEAVTGSTCSAVA